MQKLRWDKWEDGDGAYYVPKMEYVKWGLQINFQSNDSILANPRGKQCSWRFSILAWYPMYNCFVQQQFSKDW